MLQVAVNFPLMVKIVGKSRVKLRMGQMRQALKNLIRRHAKLIVSGNGADGDASAFDDGHPVQNSRAGGDVRIFNAICFHVIKLTALFKVSKPQNQNGG